MPQEGREKRDPRSGGEATQTGLALPGAPSGGGGAGGRRGEPRSERRSSAPGRAQQALAARPKRQPAATRATNAAATNRGPPEGKRRPKAAGGPPAGAPGPEAAKRARSGPPAPATPHHRATGPGGNKGRAEPRRRDPPTPKRGPRRTGPANPTGAAGGQQGRPGPGKRSAGATRRTGAAKRGRARRAGTTRAAKPLYPKARGCAPGGGAGRAQKGTAAAHRHGDTSDHAPPTAQARITAWVWAEPMRDGGWPTANAQRPPGPRPAACSSDAIYGARDRAQPCYPANLTCKFARSCASVSIFERGGPLLDTRTLFRQSHASDREKWP